MNIWRIIGFTIFQAAVSTLVAIVIGFAAAYYVAKKKSFFSRLLVSLSGIPLSVPPLLIALGYILFFGNNGTLNRFLMAVCNLEEPPIRILYSFTGIIIAHGFYNFPIIMKSVADVWQRLPEEEEWVASLFGASRFQIFRYVSVPHLIAPLVSSSAIVFLFCFFSFLIVLLFGPVGLTTLEVEVYRASRVSFDFERAALLAFIETAVALAIVFVYSRLETRGILTEGQSFRVRKKTPMTARSGIFALVLFCIIAIFFLSPLCSIPLKAFSAPATFAKLFSHQAFVPALTTSVSTASMTALLSTAFAFLYALFVRVNDPKKQNRVLRFLPFVPMAISSVVLGFVMSYIVSRFARTPTLFTLSLCQACLFWPFAFWQIQSVADKIPHELDEVAMLFAPSLLYRVVHVYFPLMKNALVSALCFSFAMSLGDASLPLVLAIPNVQTLALFTYRLAGSYRFAEACAAGTIVLALSMVLFFVGDIDHEKKKTW